MKKIIYAGLVVAVLLAAGWFVLYGSDDNDSNDNQQVESTEQTVEENASQEADENITFSDDGRTVTYSGEDGKDALTVLKDLTAVEAESSSLGEYVTSINGVAADPNTEFWAFYVNGELASEGAGTYQTKSTDTIEWRIDKIEL